MLSAAFGVISRYFILDYSLSVSREQAIACLELAKEILSNLVFKMN